MLASIFSLNVLQTALELGCIYALVALALFLSYSEVRYTHPVYSGDFMEYSGWIEKVGNTSLTCHFEAHKVIELARGEKDGLADSAANVLPEPILCAYGTGTLVVKKQYQRVEFADPKFQNH